MGLGAGGVNVKCGGVGQRCGWRFGELLDWVMKEGKSWSLCGMESGRMVIYGEGRAGIRKHVEDNRGQCLIEMQVGA